MERLEFKKSSVTLLVFFY